MSYKVHRNIDGSYDIFEKDTETMVTLRTIESRARDLCRKMNLGSGFNGWTPEFFNAKYPLPVDAE